VIPGFDSKVAHTAEAALDKSLRAGFINVSREGDSIVAKIHLFLTVGAGDSLRSNFKQEGIVGIFFVAEYNHLITSITLGGAPQTV
jgi:hypothetical protein